MTDRSTSLSDRALAVFAFAAYHQLESGEPVARVVAKDGAGHHADSGAIAELSERGLAELEGDRIVFTQDGEKLLGKAIEVLRGIGG
jgi:chromosome segregation and condensation protein ScpB